VRWRDTVEDNATMWATENESRAEVVGWYRCVRPCGRMRAVVTGGRFTPVRKGRECRPGRFCFENLPK